MAKGVRFSPEEQRARDLAHAKMRKTRRKQALRAARQLGTHTEQQWQSLAAFCGRCLLCGTEPRANDIARRITAVWLTKDHIVPVSAGGSDGIENIQPLCVACNSSKHDKPGQDLRPDGWEWVVGLI